MNFESISQSISSSLSSMQFARTGAPYMHGGKEFVQLFQAIPQIEPLYTHFEKNYNGEFIRQWMSDNWPTVFAFLGAYAAMIYFGPKFMAKRERFDLRYPLAAWSGFLSVFSFIGMMRTVPHLLYLLQAHSFKETICTFPFESYGHGASGLWVQLFMISKIPELLDTFFIVARKNDLIFLHWYHHITVLLYCWHAGTTMAGAGLYFVAMNYSVHAIMYGYYCLKALKSVPRGFPTDLITAAQIAQMFVGTFICGASLYHYSMDSTCSASPANLAYGSLMYGSYLYLFCEFYVKKYLFGAKEGKGKEGMGKEGKKGIEGGKEKAM